MIKLGIRGKMILMVTSALIIAISAAAFMIRDLVYNNIYDQKITTVEILTESIIHDIKYEKEKHAEASIGNIISKYMTYYRIIQDMHFYDRDHIAIADSIKENIGTKTEDPDISNAITTATPSLSITGSDNKQLAIRSIAPVLQGSKVVGAIVLDISISDIDELISNINKRIAMILLITIIVASIALFFMLRRGMLTRLSHLVGVTSEISTGNFNIKVDDSAQDEIGVLSQAFNHMAVELNNTALENAELYASLEDKVKERTAALEGAQQRILNLEKETTEKQMAGGFAHEMRNALAGPMILLDKASGADESGNRIGLNMENSHKLKEMYLILTDLLSEEALKPILDKMKSIFSNEEKLDEILTMVKSSVSRSLAITQQIMDYAKIGEQSHQNKLLYPDELIRGVVEDYREQFSLSNIGIDLHIGAEDVTILSNETQIYSVISNILINAKDALADNTNGSDANTKTCTIGLFTNCCEEKYVVKIQDNGTGMSPETKGKIFNTFFSTKPDTGTGLGLSIVKKIISNYGGAIEVESELGIGTIFTISLPIEKNNGTKAIGHRDEL